MKPAIRLGAALLSVAVASLTSGCSSSDVCDGVTAACLAVRIEAPEVAQTDQLQIGLSENGGPSVLRLTSPASGQPAAFPVSFPLLLGGGGAVSFTVVAELAGVALASGQGAESLGSGEHKRLTVTLSAPAATPLAVSPAARSSAGLAYFPDRQTVVLFGGVDAQGSPLSDTWEYSPATARWSPLAPLSQPSPRAASLTYHPRRQSLVMFGGQGVGGQLLGDLWLFERSGSWTQLNLLSAPSARSGAALVYDYFRDGLELYGGRDASSAQPLSDFWELPASSLAWTTRPSAAPPPVVSLPHLVFDGRYTLLVGSDDTTQSAIKVFRADPTLWSELVPPGGSVPPTRRSDFSVAFDRQAGALLLFGGAAAGAALSDSYLFNPVDLSWSAIPSPGPSARSGAGIDYVPGLGAVLLRDGHGTDGVPLADSWLYSNKTWRLAP